MATRSYSGEALDLRYQHITERDYDDTSGETVGGSTSDDKGSVTAVNVPTVASVDLKGAIEDEDDRPWSCGVCGARFARETEKTGHMASHSDGSDSHMQRRLDGAQTRLRSF